jgi:hypothetical protein
MGLAEMETKWKNRSFGLPRLTKPSCTVLVAILATPILVAQPVALVRMSRLRAGRPQMFNGSEMCYRTTKLTI